MPNSLVNQTKTTPQKRICDFCGESSALLYCRADSAKLCFTCDREVHSTNPLFTKHKRFQLCDVCDESPATILCFTEHSVLCQNCDFKAHTVLGSSLPHDRRPLEGFCGCPSAYELSGLVGVEDFDAKCWKNDGFSDGFLSGFDDEDDGFGDLFKWDNPSVVSIDELIDSSNHARCFQPIVVRPLSKDRNQSCGKHKQEILHQLYKLAKSDPDVEQDFNTLSEHYNVADQNEKDCMLPDYLNDDIKATLRGHEARSWGDDADEAVNDVFVSSALSEIQFKEDASHSVRPSCGSDNLAVNVCDSQDHIGSENVSLPHTPKLAIHEFNSAERDSALSRYKEKRRARRYDKHIRYESRKVQAEHRIRIKGRFAKKDLVKKRA